MKTTRRGQVEPSFQWIFVLIAGAVFLAIFLFAFKSCTQTGQERMQSHGVKSAALRISGDAWKPEFNDSVTMPQVSVSCPANATIILTPRADGAQVSAPLDRVPAFLPPVLGGRSRTVTRSITLRTSPSIGLGNVLYATSEETYFYVIDDPFFNKPLALLGPDQRIKRVSNAELNALIQGLPRTAVVVIASTAAVDPASAGITPKEGAAVYWARFDASGTVQFYEYGAGRGFRKVGEEKYATDYLIAGAIIAGKPDTYQCAKTNIASRMRYVTQIAESRSAALALNAALTPLCRQKLGEGETVLHRINNLPDDRYLDDLFSAADLNDKQRQLYERSCPVIA